MNHPQIAAKHNALFALALLLGAPVTEDMTITPSDDLIEMTRKQNALIAAVGTL